MSDSASGTAEGEATPLHPQRASAVPRRLRRHILSHPFCVGINADHLKIEVENIWGPNNRFTTRRFGYPPKGRSNSNREEQRGQRVRIPLPPPATSQPAAQRRNPAGSLSLDDMETSSSVPAYNCQAIADQAGGGRLMSLVFEVVLAGPANDGFGSRLWENAFAEDGGLAPTHQCRPGWHHRNVSR